MKKIIILLIIAVSIISCAKERAVIPKEYVGHWECTDYSIGGLNIFYDINIGENGYGSYQKDGIFDDDKVSGQIKIEGDLLYIKRTKLKIDKAPELHEDCWVMTIDGREYSR